MTERGNKGRRGQTYDLHLVSTDPQTGKTEEVTLRITGSGTNVQRGLAHIEREVDDGKLKVTRVKKGGGS